MLTVLQIFNAHKNPKTGNQIISQTKSKHNNRWVIIDKIKFQSTGEGYYYLELKSLLERGEIKDFKRQVKFDFWVNDIKVGQYQADFVTLDFNGTLTVIDYKGRHTLRFPLYQLKKALMLACYGTVIKEVGIK